MLERHLDSANSKNGKIANSAAFVGVAELELHIQDWLFEGEFRSHSVKTTETRRIFTKNLLWFLKQQGYTTCDRQELKAFFVYLGKPAPEGRWDNRQFTKPLRPVSIKDYFVNIQIMFRWCVSEGLIEASPMETLAPPIVQAGQIQPFAPEQITALFEAARKSTHAKRDVAILSLLLDCGLRAGELCHLKVGDIDLNACCVSVIGKGNKRRAVYFGKVTGKALRQHLRSKGQEGENWAFLSNRGVRTGEPLKPNGLLQLFQRLGNTANIKAVRCSPHTLRHTYAISFLRAGGSVFTLRENLGHTDLSMTSKYVAVAEADKEQSKMFSPVDRLRSRNF
jgi:site-specific recombinase XerD